MNLIETIKRKIRINSSKYSWKYDLVKSYGSKYGCRILVETGTFLGDMVYSQRDNFDRIYTIELSDKLYFKSLDFLFENGINCFYGDSAIMLPQILRVVDAPTLFWLDAHYSGWITAKSEPPIIKELTAILGHHLASNHVILIDDISLYNGGIDNIKSLLSGRNSANYITNDILVSVPIECALS